MKMTTQNRLVKAALIGAFAIFAAEVTAQETPVQPEPRRIDPGRVLDVLRDRLEQARADDPEKDAQADGLIDFETIRSDSARRAVPLTTQYRESHGVTFGRGVSVHLCTDDYDEFARSACPYPRAASGQRAALYDIETGGNRFMTIDFVNGVSTVSAKINPTGGNLDEEFIAQMNGFDANGTRIATNSLRFRWFQDAFAWPTEISMTGKGVMARVTIELRRVASNNQNVRFLIDDLRFAIAEEEVAPPVAAGLAALDGPPRVGRGQIVQSPRVGPAQSELQIYPAATRKRLAVDWDRVEAALADQQTLGLTAAKPIRDGQKYIDQAELPVLLPQAADPGTLMVFGNKDTINAVWRIGGRGYSAYGSRLVTVLQKPGGAPGVREAITFSGSEDELTGAFKLYGVSWTITQYCQEGGESADPACYDRDRLGEVAGDLVVAVGEAGRARP